MTKELKRLTDDKIIFGICSGVAAYLGWDKTVVRLLVVFIFLVTGIFPVALIYIIAYFIMPKNNGNNIIR